MEAIKNTLRPFAKILRFLISGGSAAVINLSVLYVFTDVLHVYYVASSVVAFLFAFVLSFTLQKYWTFKETSQELIKRQLALYLIAAAVNLGFNTLLIYCFVEYAGFHYLLAQVATSAIIAIESFFLYKHIIFKTPSAPAAVPL